jgi:hypothetical protein
MKLTREQALRAIGVCPSHNRIAGKIERRMNASGGIGEVFEPDRRERTAKIQFLFDARPFDIRRDPFTNAGRALRAMAAELIAAAERVEGGSR